MQGVEGHGRRRPDQGDKVHRPCSSRRSALAAACSAAHGCGRRDCPKHEDYLHTSYPHALHQRACKHGSVSRAGRRQAPALLLVFSAVCVLHCPPTGADMHRVVSSPDLASVARQRGTCNLPADYKERLKETPEMRLKKHLEALKATAAIHGFYSSSPGQTGVANSKHWHASSSTPAMDSPFATGTGDDPRRRLFDDEHFSTVTPEPSESMPGAPLSRLRQSGIEKRPLQGSPRLLPTGANDETFKGLKEYWHVERSIAVGKPTSKTSVICFDFDRTLSQDHLHQMTQLSRTGLTTQEAVAAFGGYRRIQHLSAFLSELEACGAAIHIISLGHKSAIADSLRLVGLGHLFSPDRIIGCDELRCLRLVTKAQCIAYVASLYGLQRGDALLVDDDHEQLLECRESPESDLPLSCVGMQGPTADTGTCGTYWVRSGRGLTERDMAAIGGMARTRKQLAVALNSQLQLI